MNRDALIAVLAPLSRQIAELKGHAVGEALAVLRSLDTEAVEAALRAAHAEGWLTNKEAGGVRFGRLTRASESSAGLSIDVVDMAGPASAPHTHVTGEYDLCLVLEGSPRFDGHGPGWVVYPPGSRHIPTVTGGRMLIAYFVPGGEIRFE